MNREIKRATEKERGRDDDRRAEERAAVKAAKKRDRTGVRQFLREVRGELKRVSWPSRKEVLSYSVVVLVAVVLVGVYVFALDQAFGQLVFWIFE
jgi:preprotein translocase subunit SecE